MKYALLIFLLPLSQVKETKSKIFDVHLHGSADPVSQLTALRKAGVYKIAVSTSWNSQQEYRATDSLAVLHGLMVPCPVGKVPYSRQQCFDDGSEYPALAWVEDQVKAGRIDFLGEVLSQYHGVSSSDSMLLPYYALAEKYSLPVGIHTGSAGPDHGCPNFREDMGNPLLMKILLDRFPKLRVWIMHAGMPYLAEAIEIMKKYPNVYTDVSAINNPMILPAEEFQKVLRKLIENGLEDRIMFGSDNGDIQTMAGSINNSTVLSNIQKQKILHLNAEKFFISLRFNYTSAAFFRISSTSV